MKQLEYTTEHLRKQKKQSIALLMVTQRLGTVPQLLLTGSQDLPLSLSPSGLSHVHLSRGNY